MRKKSFTLIELLVVVAIIAVLVSILLPALARARFQVQVTQCLSNMKQIAMGLFAYESEYNDKLPTYYWTGSAWKRISLVTTWQLATNGGWYNDLVSKFLRIFTPVPSPANIPNAPIAAYVADPRVYYCPGNGAHWYKYPYSWNNTVDPEYGRIHPGWSYFQMPYFNGPQGYRYYDWYRHPFAKGSYPLFCDPVYYQTQTGRPKEGNCNHYDPNKPPQNVVFSDGHAETLYQGDMNYYIVFVSW